MNKERLAAALREKAADLRNCIGLDHVDDRDLRDAAELIRVLANVVDGMPLPKAFGAPGDWGYETKIGQAIFSAQSEVKP